MARTFVKASSQKLSRSSAPVSGPPLTMACWFKPNDVTNEHSLMAVSDTATNVNYHYLEAAGNVAGDPIRTISRDTPLQATAVTSTSFSAGAWQHACGVWASTTDRRAFLNGGGKGTNATSCTPTGLDTTTVATITRLVGDVNFADGDIAEAAIWNVALTDDEVAVLATGVAATAVRPASLVAYWPIIGRFSPEIDLTQAAGLTVTGATAAAHPPIRYPVRQRITKAIPVVVSSGHGLPLVNAGLVNMGLVNGGLAA